MIKQVFAIVVKDAPSLHPDYVQIIDEDEQLYIAGNTIGCASPASVV